MVSLNQTNYFYIDIDKKISVGVSECLIEEKGQVEFIVGNRKIEEVSVNGEIVQINVIQIDDKNIEDNKFQIKEKLDRRNHFILELNNTKNTITIKYTPNLKFYNPIDEFDKHKEALGMIDQFVSFPYINKLTKFKFIYVVQSDLTVTSSGQLHSVVEEENFAVHTYYSTTSPKNIAFSIGTFETYEISSSKTFVLPRYENYSELKNDISASQKYLDNFLTSDRPIIISFLFTMLQRKKTADSVVINPFASFPTADNIALNFNFRKELGYFLAFQIFTKIWFEQEDLWILSGLIGYVGDYILKNILGTNEFLYRFKKNIEYVVQEDKYHLPLYSNSRSSFSYSSRFVKTKSTLFLHMLENSTSLAFIQKIVQSLLNLHKITTKDFLNVVRDTTGKDLDNEKLIFKNTCTTYTGEVTIDLKKNAVKVSFNGPVNTIIQSNEIEGVFEYPIKKEITYNYHNRRKRDEDSVLFIKIDPYMTQLNSFKFLLKNTMYNLLTRDKNLLSQMEGVQHVDETELERIIYDSHVNYHIKLMAMNHLGLNSILSFFVKKFCVHGSTIIKPNSFTVLNHMVLVGLIRTLSYFDPNIERHVNGKNVSIGAIIKAFYYNILRYNDNSSNHYDDSAFIAEIIVAFSHMMTCGYDNFDDEIYKKNEIYFDIIERYRVKDLIFPSNENRITCAILHFYGRLDLYGIIELNDDFLLQLIEPRNYLKIRCKSAEIFTFRLLLSDRHNEIQKKLEYLLSQDDAIKKTVLQTILNLICTELYNKHLRTVLDAEFFKGMFFRIECDDVRNKLIEVIYFVQGKDILIENMENIDHELCSSEESKTEELRLKCIPIGKLRIKINLSRVPQEESKVCRINPFFSSGGVVKLKINQEVALKRKLYPHIVKRAKTQSKNIRVHSLQYKDFNTNFLLNRKAFSKAKHKLSKLRRVDEKMQTEFDIIKALREVFMENDQKSDIYEQALQICTLIEDSKFEVPIDGHHFTVLSPQQKNEVKKYLENLSIPHFSRSKKYKDVVRRPQTIHFLKKKLDGVVLLESLKLEIYRFLENIKFFSGQQNLDCDQLVNYLSSIKEKKDSDLYECLEMSFDYLKTKKASALFIEEVDTNEYRKVIQTPMYLDLILHKIRKREYKTIREIENHIELIVANAEKFNGFSSHTAVESRNFHRWYKRIVGGMLSDLYKDID